jgi:hypothetical protein
MTPKKQGLPKTAAKTHPKRADDGRPAAQPPADPVPARLKELEQALGAAAEATDMLESLLGLCERMEAKCQRVASLSDRFPAWPPLALLHSAAAMSKRDVIGELEKLTANMARLGAEYRLLRSERKDHGGGQEGSANG